MKHVKTFARAVYLLATLYHASCLEDVAKNRHLSTQRNWSLGYEIGNCSHTYLCFIKTSTELPLPSESYILHSRSLIVIHNCKVVPFSSLNIA